MLTDPKSAKRQSSHQCLSVLLGSARIKAACKTLVKSTPPLLRQTHGLDIDFPLLAPTKMTATKQKQSIRA